MQGPQIQPIEVHWVYSSCPVKPGQGLGSCLSKECNSALRVEAQVFVVVNDSSALDFTKFDYAGSAAAGLHQPRALPSGTGTPVVFRGSTTGPDYSEPKLSPLQVTWSVRPNCAKVDISSLHRWCQANVFAENHGHGVRPLVTSCKLLDPIQAAWARGRRRILARGSGWCGPIAAASACIAIERPAGARRSKLTETFGRSMSAFDSAKGPAIWRQRWRQAGELLTIAISWILRWWGQFTVSVTLFLSTVSDEFRDYRDQLRRDLTRHNVEVKVQEYFKDHGDVTLDKLDTYVANCDAVIHLVGDMTGAAAKPASTQAMLDRYPDIAERLPPLGEALAKAEPVHTYTQWEAWLALYHRKTLLIATPTAHAPRGPNSAPTAASRAEQQRHLERLRRIERYPGSVFSSPDELAKQIGLLENPRPAGSRTWREVCPEYANDVGDGGGRPAGGDAARPLCRRPVGEDARRIRSGAAGAVDRGGGIGAAVGVRALFRAAGGRRCTTGHGGTAGLQALRANLLAGGSATKVYTRWLTMALDRVDGFFGDAGKAHATLFPVRSA